MSNTTHDAGPALPPSDGPEATAALGVTAALRIVLWIPLDVLWLFWVSIVALQVYMARRTGVRFTWYQMAVNALNLFVYSRNLWRDVNQLCTPLDLLRWLASWAVSVCRVVGALSISFVLAYVWWSVYREMVIFVHRALQSRTPFLPYRAAEHLRALQQRHDAHKAVLQSRRNDPTSLPLPPALATVNGEEALRRFKGYGVLNEESKQGLLALLRILEWQTMPAVKGSAREQLALWAFHALARAVQLGLQQRGALYLRIPGVVIWGRLLVEERCYFFTTLSRGETVYIKVADSEAHLKEEILQIASLAGPFFTEVQETESYLVAYLSHAITRRRLAETETVLHRSVVDILLARRERKKALAKAMETRREEEEKRTARGC
ncbi:hypothetical protein JCM10213_005969 [Rhodosporidiobolus nylandii]